MWVCKAASAGPLSSYTIMITNFLVSFMEWNFFPRLDIMSSCTQYSTQYRLF